MPKTAEPYPKHIVQAVEGSNSSDKAAAILSDPDDYFTYARLYHEARAREEVIREINDGLPSPLRGIGRVLMRILHPAENTA